MRLLIILSLLFSGLFALSDSEKIAKVGIVKKVKGTVKRLETGSIKKEKVTAGDQLKNGDMVITYGKASALLELFDGSQVVLDEGAMIKFAGLESIEQQNPHDLRLIESIAFNELEDELLDEAEDTHTTILKTRTFHKGFNHFTSMYLLCI